MIKKALIKHVKIIFGMERKIIVCDVDGTTLKAGENYFKKEVKDAFNKVLNEKSYLVVASGRTYRNLYKIFDKNNDVIYIAENGNQIVFNNEFLKINKFEKEKSLGIIKYLYSVKKELIAILISTPFEAIYYEDSNIYIDEEEEPRYKNIDLDGLISYLTNKEVIKISIFKEKRDKRFYEIYDFLIKKFKDIEVFDANNRWIDISPLNGNKGGALKYVIEKFDISNFPLYVFGDGENDISMLTLTKNSYCPNDALEKVKKIVNHQYVHFEEVISSIF